MSEQDPKHDAYWDAVEEAAELLRDGEHDEARQLLRAVLDADPRNPYAHYFLATSLFERGDFAAARDEYASALDGAPNYLGAVIGLGHSLRLLGKLDDAIREGERALRMSADTGGDPDAHYLLGLVHASLGAKDKAIGHLEAFIASQPEVEVRHDAEAMLQTLRGEAKPMGDA